MKMDGRLWLMVVKFDWFAFAKLGMGPHYKGKGLWLMMMTIIMVNQVQSSIRRVDGGMMVVG